MQTLASSPERLADRGALEALKGLFLYHGVLGYRDTTRGRDIQDLDRFSILPLVFGLLPATVLSRVSSTAVFQPAKPLLADHLVSLGIEAEELLLDVLKSVAEQWASTRPGRTNRRKYSVTDVRALGTPYRTIRGRQNGRCRYCGRVLAVSDEALDHTVPFRLIGDVADGANWQLLCSDCNLGKGEFLTTLAMPVAYNWVYSFNEKDLTDVRIRTRWVVLAQRGRCDSCGAGPDVAELHVIPRREGDAFIADLLTISCDGHLLTAGRQL
jgi:5-methylcytosine-specific restriction endonuclease McrA